MTKSFPKLITDPTHSQHPHLLLHHIQLRIQHMKRKFWRQLEYKGTSQRESKLGITADFLFKTTQVGDCGVTSLKCWMKKLSFQNFILSKISYTNEQVKKFPRQKLR